MKKRTIAFAIIFAFLLPLVFAQTSASLVDPKAQATISPLGEAKFDVTITNTIGEADVLMLELSDVAWSLRTAYTPDFTTGIELSKYGTKDTTIYMKPDKSLAPGTYFVELRTVSRTTKKITSSKVFVIKIDPKVVDYKIKIDARLAEPLSIDPEKTNSVKLVLKNPYPVYLENISIETSSKFLNKKTTVDINPNSEKSVEFSLNIDSSTPKQEDEVAVVVKQGDKEIANTKQTIYIKEYKIPYQVDKKVTSKFLQKITEITFTNTEGAQKTRDAMIEKPKTFAVVFSIPPSETTMFNGVKYLVWKDVALNPDESYKVKMIEDFRPLTAVVLAIIILIVLYYTLRSPIIVKKKAYAIHKKDTGNNEIKVLVHIKNRTGRTLEKVRVLERLPIIHKVEPDFGPGTPEPKFRRGHEGIVLDWDIVLAPHEERLFTYKIKSALPLVGEHTLRPCVVQYGSKGKRTSSDSYRVVLE